MPMINIDDAYILDETGAEVDKVTGLFTKDEDTTSGEKALAQLNIGTAGSNRNLLDNPWFTVNQRSATTVTLNGTEAYIADRWIVGAFGTYTHNSDNTITITCPNSTAFAGLTQRIDPVYKGGTYTYSIRLSDDTVISLQGTMPSGSGLNVYNITINGTAWQVLFRSDGSAYWVTLRCNVANTTITIKAVKLELGSVSTLANDAPPDYAEELRKCQYYYREWSITSAGGFAIAWPWSNANATIMNIFGIGNEMRTKSPTITWSGSWTVRTQSGANIAITNISKADSPTAIGIDITVASGLTNNQPCRVTADSGAKITFSADL